MFEIIGEEKFSSERKKEQGIKVYRAVWYSELCKDFLPAILFSPYETIRDENPSEINRRISLIHKDPGFISDVQICSAVQHW